MSVYGNLLAERQISISQSPGGILGGPLTAPAEALSFRCQSTNSNIAPLIAYGNNSAINLLSCSSFHLFSPETCPACALCSGNLSAGRRRKSALPARLCARSRLPNPCPARSLGFSHATPRQRGDYPRSPPARTSRIPSKNSFNRRNRLLQRFNLLFGLPALLP